MEVYDKVPTKITAWIVIIPKLSLFVILFEIMNFISTGTASGLADFTPFYAESYSALQQVYNGSLDFSTPYIYNLNNLASAIAPIANNIHTLPVTEPASVLANTGIENLFKNFLILSSLVSLIIGSLLGLSQIRIKKLLAFSAISHIGFLLLSLSINTEIALESFFFYLIQYTITNLNIFVILLVLGNLMNNNSVAGAGAGAGASYSKTATALAPQTTDQLVYLKKEQKPESSLDLNFISELKGIFEFNPILSLSLTISLFSMAGVPPLIGFFGKQQVLYSAISADFILISIIAIFMSVISAYYYLNLIKISNFEKSDQHSISRLAFSPFLAKQSDSATLSNEEAAKISITNTSSLLISIITLILILFIVNPNLILNSIHVLALSLFDG